ncbi:MAG: HAD family phosphatase [Verrucomicrobiota bacterium]
MSSSTHFQQNSIEAVIFDMDGLLIDTEKHARRAWRQAADAMSLNITDDQLANLVGRHVEDCLDILGEALNLDLRELHFLERVDDIYYSNFMRYGIDVKAGVTELLDALTQANTPLAVATSSEREVAPRKLRLAGIEHYFPLIVSGCEVPKSKPAPDIFLLTAQRLGIEPAKCLVLEDSYTGVRGAKAAGMSVFMIPDQLPPTSEMLEISDGIYDSVSDATSTILEALKHSRFSQ